MMTSAHSEVLRGVPLGIGSGDIIDCLDGWLRQREITPHPACRYAQYREILHARRDQQVCSRSVPEQLYATAELHQMLWIVTNLGDDASMSRAITEAFFQDPTVPLGTVHSPGRDRQFELYVAARLQMAQLRPVFAEPDLRAELEEWTFGVAIKRVKSPKAFCSAVKGARDQIRRTGENGIIILDCSYLAAGEHIPYMQGDLDSGHTWAQRFSQQTFQPQWLAIQRRIPDPSAVFGVLVIARLFQLHPDRHTHIISELLISRPLCSGRDDRSGKFAAIEERLRVSVSQSQPEPTGQ